MLIPRRTRHRLSTVVLSVVGALVCFIAGSTFFSNVIPRFVLPVDAAKAATLWLSAAFSVSYLAYSVVIWRLIFPHYDINGRWRYENTYDHAVDDGREEQMTSSSGWVEIRQTLDAITYRGARTHRNGATDSLVVDFKTLAFDVADDHSAVMLYEVRRQHTVRSMEELRIQIAEAGLPPAVIRGRFCSLEPTPTYTGVALYKYEQPCSLLDRCVEQLRAWSGKRRPVA